MMKNARPAAEQLGVDLVDVRHQPRSICRSRFRIRCSNGCARRSKAQAAKLPPRALNLRAHACRRQQAADEILADAARQAGQIAGRAMPRERSLARSYSKNAEFYSFYAA